MYYVSHTMINQPFAFVWIFQWTVSKSCFPVGERKNKTVGCSDKTTNNCGERQKPVSGKIAPFGGLAPPPPPAPARVSHLPSTPAGLAIFRSLPSFLRPASPLCAFFGATQTSMAAACSTQLGIPIAKLCFFGTPFRCASDKASGIPSRKKAKVFMILSWDCLVDGSSFSRKRKHV